MTFMEKVRKLFTRRKLSSNENNSKWREGIKIEKGVSKAKAGLFWSGALVAGLVLMILGLKPAHHNEASKKDDVDHPTNIHNFQNELAENLAYLHSMQNKVLSEQQSMVHAINNLSPTFKAFKSDDQLSQEMRLRMNASSTVYQAPVLSASQNMDANQNAKILTDNSENAAFANKIIEATSVEAKKLLHPEYTLAEGEFIPAILETAINSDLPGLVRAMVAQPVYAYVSDRILIPAGSRLIGQYSSALVQGQSRVIIIWNRIILPNGVTAQIDSPDVDSLGRAGQGADSINTHFFARFGGAILISFLTAGASTYDVNPQNPYNSITSYRQALSEALAQSAAQSLQYTLAIKPTLHIYQGAAINVFVAHDISFYQMLKGK